MKVEFYRHNISSREISDLNNTLRSLFLTTGKVTEKFENDFSKYLKREYAAGVTSCTAALHLSLYALGIKSGDEVITTPLSFYATANAILYVGAKPVFVDIEEDTGLIDPRLIEKAITSKTKAIIPVHMYGQMCDMKKIFQIAGRHKLKIIEDAAICVEGGRDGISPGKLSDTACFSFHAIKSITSGEGGAIITDNKILADKLKFMRLHGMGRTVVDRYKDKLKKQDMLMLGFKYNMYDLQASLLLNQLNNIDVLYKKREKLYVRYLNGFKGNKNVKVPVTRKNSKNSFSLFTIFVDPRKRDEYLVKLQERGIGVDVKYRTIHLSTYYRKKFGYKEGDYPIAERLSDATITLPLYPKLKSSEVDFVIKHVNQITKNR